MKNKRTIMIGAGIAIVVIAAVIAAVFVFRQPGTKKSAESQIGSQTESSSPAESGLTAEDGETERDLPALSIDPEASQEDAVSEGQQNKQDNGTAGKNTSGNQTDPAEQKSGSDASGQGGNSGTGNKAETTPILSRPNNQTPSASKENKDNTGKAENPAESTDHSQSTDSSDQNSDKKKTDQIELPFVPAN